MSFSTHELLASIRDEHFSQLHHQVDLYFVNRGPLACISREKDRAAIYIHQVLNHSETPVAVIRLILKHELLHLVIPPTKKGNKTVRHPPEFWAAERKLVPDRGRAWSWIHANLHCCLKRRPRLERIDVLRNWKEVWSQAKIDIDACAERNHYDPKRFDESGW